MDLKRVILQEHSKRQAQKISLYVGSHPGRFKELFIEIPKRYHGHVAEICFKFLQDIKEPVAIRVFSMRVLSYICEANPEIKKELKIILEDNLPYATPGFYSRAIKVLKELQ